MSSEELRGLFRSGRNCPGERTGLYGVRPELRHCAASVQRVLMMPERFFNDLSAFSESACERITFLDGSQVGRAVRLEQVGGGAGCTLRRACK